jgi:hypothetical protein
MNVQNRRKLGMASSVRDFSVAHPFDNVGHTDAVERLKQQLDRAEALAQQEQTGRLVVSASVVSTAELRKMIREDLRLLVGLAGPLSAELPEIATRLRLPRHNLNHQSLLTAGRVAVTQATAQRDLFLKYGMPENHLERLTELLDRLEVVANERHAGTAAHVGARADLDAITDEIMRTVRQLDAINRYRFRDDAEQLAAWKSARDVAWPGRLRAGTEPAAGEAKPAA